VFRICPDLPISAAVCLHIGGHKLAVYTKKITGGRGSALNLAGGAHDAPPDPQVEPPDGLHLWRSHPMICAFSVHLRLRCPNCVATWLSWWVHV